MCSGTSQEGAEKTVTMAFLIPENKGGTRVAGREPDSLLDSWVQASGEAPNREGCSIFLVFPRDPSAQAENSKTLKKLLVSRRCF